MIAILLQIDNEFSMSDFSTMGAHGWQRCQALGGALLDLLLPPRCLACGILVDVPGRLCADCWSQLAFLLERPCQRCGLPLAGIDLRASLCGHRRTAPPGVARARAALRYEGAARPLILRFKHGDRLDGAATYARWMVRAGAELLASAELILPVPLHRWRLLARGYNQSAELARRIGRQTGLPVLVDGLHKTVHTRAQQSLGATERQRNVTAAVFALHRHGRRSIGGRRVLLIDDVLTTGSTAAACAATLLKGGAAAVDVLTLARVVQSRDEPISL